jgi:hypothetical protein
MTSPLLEWRPIDTCPKDDGAVVLVSDGNRVEPAVWANWGGSHSGWEFGSRGSFEPAYWMALPPPPTNQAPASAP